MMEMVRMVLTRWFVLHLAVIVTWCNAALYGRPHIIFIVADDLGWNDVGFHGSDQIPTPNIDALAFNGIVLNSHYAGPACTPSRAALMTGKYPIRIGMQGKSILGAEPRALPSGKILPQYLKDLGYVTRAVGKWHLGFYRREFTPTYRGFDSHFGFWSETVSYYDYILQDIYAEGDYNGFDLRRNLSLAREYSGKYATDIFTDEALSIINKHDTSTPLFLYLAHLAPHAGNAGKWLEAPQEVINKFSYIADPNRRTYAAMVSKLDESVGKLTAALQSRAMLQNSVIVFISDNGAPTIGERPNWGSNYPLRGVKETLWEGALRTPAFIWSPKLQQSGRISNQLMHITDWLPTLYSAAGGPALYDSTLDGHNMWQALSYNLPSPRTEILHNIDEKARTASIRSRNWKLVIGSTKNGIYDKSFGHTGRDHRNPPYSSTSVTDSSAGRAIAELYRSLYRVPKSPSEIPYIRSLATLSCTPPAVYSCNPATTKENCLYDIERDPCETNNLALVHPDVAKSLRRLLVGYRSVTLVKQSNVPVDWFAADPKRWNDAWTTWGDGGV